MIDLHNTKIAFSYKGDKELNQSFWIFKWMRKINLQRFSMFISPAFLYVPFLRRIIKNTMFWQFVGGQNIEEVSKVVEKLNYLGVKSIIDYGIEAQECEAHFDEALKQFIRSVQHKSNQPSIKYISVKLSALFPSTVLREHTQYINNHIFDFVSIKYKNATAWNNGLERISLICDSCEKCGVVVMIDAEESWFQDAIDVITTQMMRKYNKATAIVYNSFQLYRKDKLSFLKESYTYAKSHQFVLGAKIVRGAYMEKENKYAQKANCDSIILANKRLVNQSFDEGVQFSVEHADSMMTIIATHNESSITKAITLMRKQNISLNHPAIHISQLYGMGDHITFNLAYANMNVSKYIPYGDLQSVFRYLIRRARENSSVAGQTTREFQLLKNEMIRRNLIK